ncbi:MAG: ribosomal protein S18 acetylase RimI-like enzyme [Candidatus Poriferisodalaceae bacterium]|jgi:ribosomal protein S18 acetylase RimI-like enzyme
MEGSVAVEIAPCEVVDDEVVEAFAHLIPQLSRSSPAPTKEVLQNIVDHDACTLLIARLDGRIVGSMTLVLFPIPTGIRAWIEDVVVDESARGHGIGDKINRRAIEIAEEAGAKSVDLTSRPSREAANRLYQRMGFVARETNVYRYDGN